MDRSQARALWASSEFAEFATCDMPTADSGWHWWLQPMYDQEQRRKYLSNYMERRYAVQVKGADEVDVRKPPEDGAPMGTSHKVNQAVATETGAEKKA